MTTTMFKNFLLSNIYRGAMNESKRDEKAKNFGDLKRIVYVLKNDKDLSSQICEFEHHKGKAMLSEDEKEKLLTMIPLDKEIRKKLDSVTAELLFKEKEINLNVVYKDGKNQFIKI